MIKGFGGIFWRTKNIDDRRSWSGPKDKRRLQEMFSAGVASSANQAFLVFFCFEVTGLTLAAGGFF